ncbi:NTF2-related export protein [Cimex lectularius]|uniref:NTF2-related export protein n=1 Tax=Cimex lectularius TaxID=79782 RepID=A0A8I6RIR5_CIMLE|nr:NTF2-related export protein [Cimex lectularius]
MDQDLKAQVDLACKTGEDFTNYYYENLDKRRHLMNRLYLDAGSLIWNGNGTTGKDEIGKFLMELPVSEHKLFSLDAQKISDATLPNKLAFLIKVTGTVKYQGKIARSFTQSFVITNQDAKWKIVSDCFRLQDPIN